MKKLTLLAVILLFLAATASGCADPAEKKDYRQTFDIEKKYLLIPIEDKGPESRIRIEHNGEVVVSGLHIRIAREQVDYWIPLDVEEYRGRKLTLLADHTKKGDIGFSMIRQSDTFDFDYNDPYRSTYHFSPKYGWTNDPNGMVYLDGEYHLYYQHNPYGTRWGNMHWGHAVTRDFTKWEHLPVAISPDSLGTIFSGSAVIDKENTAGFGADALVAVYTYAERGAQTQGIAYSLDKGRTFVKYEGNPVLADPAYRDFRDPKVFWHTPSAHWVMSLATGQTISFYRSADLKSWEKTGEFGEGIGAHDGVWECPDLFTLRTPDGKEKWVLFVSINPGGPNGGSATQYFIGGFDGRQFTADPMDYPVWLDYGRDNYAGVTWSNVPEADGRRIFIGWMSNWDYTNDTPTKYFRNAMTLPRVLTLGGSGQNLVVKSYPLAEVFGLRGAPNAIPAVSVSDSFTVDRLLTENKGAFEIEMTIVPGAAKTFGFRLKSAGRADEQMEYRFDLNDARFTVDRTRSGQTGFNEKFPSADHAPLTIKNQYKINLFIDKASSEIFIDGGETVQTHTMFPAEVYNRLEFFSDGEALQIRNIHVYPLK